MKHLEKIAATRYADLTEMDFEEVYITGDFETTVALDKSGTWLFLSCNFSKEFTNRNEVEKFAESMGFSIDFPIQPSNASKPAPQERVKNRVYATGNRWAIENFKATH